MNQTKYPNLLTPWKVSDTITLKNRITAAHLPPLFSSSPNIYPDHDHREHLRSLAKAGASTVIWDYSCDEDIQKQCLSILNAALPEGEKLDKLPDTADVSHAGFGQWEYDNQLVQNQVCFCVNELHALGTRVLLNMDPLPPGGYEYSIGGGQFWSQHPDLGGIVETLPMVPHDDMPKIVDKMVEACRKFRRFGFDGISANVSDWFLRSTDCRTDEYGGSVENRGRIPRLAFETIRKEMGPDFIIECVLIPETKHGTENRAKEGYPLEDALEFIDSVKDVISWWHVRSDNMTDQSACSFVHKEGQLLVLDVCRRIKASGCKVPLSANGLFQDPNVIEKLMAEGVIDLVAMSRGLVSDSLYYKKVQEGRPEDITPCLRCNNCQGIPRFPWLQQCAVNPEYGLRTDKFFLRTTPERLKKIAVIGAGAAGLRTALLAAEKGHDVTIYEKTGYVGGVTEYADYFDFKWSIRRYRNWMIAQLKKKNVEIILNCEPTKEELIEKDYEVIFACTGSHPVKPKSIEGADNDNIKTIYNVWGHEDEFGQNIVIVGGSEAGVETGIHLAQIGKNVTVLTRQDILAGDASTLHGITMTWVKETEEGWGVMSPEWEKYDNFKGIVKASTKKVTEKSVTYEKNGQEFTIDCDSVIICGGVKPNQDAALKYAGIAREFYMVGDCEGDCGNLRSINRRAYIKVNQL